MRQDARGCDTDAARAHHQVVPRHPRSPVVAARSVSTLLGGSRDILVDEFPMGDVVKEPNPEQPCDKTRTMREEMAPRDGRD